MHTTLRVICWSVAFALCFACLRAGATSEEKDAKPDVKQLIKQLGDDEYLLRHRAEVQLLERGAEVFAELQAAEKNADLEVATRARYLLTQISIEWTRDTDPESVRSIMGRYGELSMQLKLRKIRELAVLEDQQGFGALSRIARFDSSSSLVPRYAALAILENGLLPTARVESAVAMLRDELGDSPEAPASWIEVYVDQLQANDAVDARWIELIDQEFGALVEEPNSTSDFLALSLLQTYLELGDTLSDDEAMVAGLQRRIEFGRGGARSTTAGLIDAITWLVDRSQWGALALLENGYEREIQTTRRVLYHLALAREKEGRADDAQLVAERALALVDGDWEERNSCGDLIASRGHHDWAEREWFAVVEAADSTDIESLLARSSLGMFRLSDRLEHKAAADLVGEAIDAIEADPQTSQYYQTQLYEKRNEPLLGYLDQARANRDFFLAAHFASQGEHEKQRDHLESAYERQQDNPDIIIAMYHSQDASEEYRKQTQARLQNISRQLEKTIRLLQRRSKQPNRNANRYLLSHSCNHWAWLISNTEGDFDKAVEYSQLSLKIQPGTPSYLDTLGRCYYSAGKFEEALKVQREAVAKQPYLMVMQRQLQLIEEAVQNHDVNQEQ